MFCPNLQCPLRGQLAQGNITSHSIKERRYMCNCCGRSFAETKGTPFYRRQYSSELIVAAQTLLSHGCPPQAIVAAFGVDERTLADWQQGTGKHCEQIHAAEVASGRVDTGHVQADEIWVKTVGRKCVFRSKSSTDSGRSRALIPVQAEQPRAITFGVLR